LQERKSPSALYMTQPLPPHTQTHAPPSTPPRRQKIIIYRRPSKNRQFFRRIEKLGLNTDHFDDVTPADKVFVVDSKFTSSFEIKKRLIRDFDRAYECTTCKNQAFTIKSDGVLLWNNKEIVLQLEHKNGINNDNRLDNLEFPCPSCHSQTSTFCGGNGKRSKTIQAWIEEGKTSHAPGSIPSLLN
jgi:hypothetical protein